MSPGKSKNTTTTTTKQGQNDTAGVEPATKKKAPSE